MAGDLPAMRDVYSSNVNRVGYDAASKELFVTWKSGKTSVYADVPAAIANDVTNSWSVGQAVSDQIKRGPYKHRYL